MDNFCNLCCLIAISLFFIILYATSQQLSGNGDAFDQQIIFTKNQTSYYGICSDSFGDLENEQFSEYDLSVLDITMMGYMVYEAEWYDLCELISTYFNDQFEIIKIHRSEPVYFHIRHKKAGIDIIAIRGTSSLWEMMQNCYVYLPIFT